MGIYWNYLRVELEALYNNNFNKGTGGVELELQVGKMNVITPSFNVIIPLLKSTQWGIEMNLEVYTIYVHVHRIEGGPSPAPPCRPWINQKSFSFTSCPSDKVWGAKLVKMSNARGGSGTWRHHWTTTFFRPVITQRVCWFVFFAHFKTKKRLWEMTGQNLSFPTTSWIVLRAPSLSELFCTDKTSCSWQQI